MATIFLVSIPFKKEYFFFMSITKPFVRMGGSAQQRIIVQKSCALAAQTFMLSIAAEGYHTCPMEGFDEVRVRKALNLPRIAEINMVVAVGKVLKRESGVNAIEFPLMRLYL